MTPPFFRKFDAEYFGFPGFPQGCTNSTTRLTTNLNHTVWKVSTDSYGNAMLTTVQRGCPGGERKLSVTTKRGDVGTYVTKSGSTWYLHPVKGNDCTLVQVIAKARLVNGLTSYLSSPWNCKNRETFTINLDSGTGTQWWQVVKTA